MTPMAHKVADMMLTYGKKWKHTEYAADLRPFPAVQCFEVSGVHQLGVELKNSCLAKKQIADHLSFLPSPATWIEYQHPGIGLYPTAYLLVEKEGNVSSVMQVQWIAGRGFSAHRHPDLPLMGNLDPENWALDAAIKWIDRTGYRQNSEDSERSINAWLDMCYEIHSWLALINTPSVIGRTSNKPPYGLTNRIIRAAPILGCPYELQPWHEIKLDISVASDTSSECGERLTGARALHFCRQHIRIRLGKIELVRAHWRGDASIGIARGKYTVRP